MCWGLKLKYEIWIKPLQLKFNIECFAFDFWRLNLAFKSKGWRVKIACYILFVACWRMKQFRVCGFYAIISSRSNNAIYAHRSCQGLLGLFSYIRLLSLVSVLYLSDIKIDYCWKRYKETNVENGSGFVVLHCSCCFIFVWYILGNKNLFCLINHGR